MSRTRAIFVNVRVIIFLIALVLSIFAINPTFDPKGLSIAGVAINSSAAIAGIESPTVNTAPRSRELVLAINNRPVNTVEEYSSFVDNLPPESTFALKTSKSIYRITTKPLIRRTQLNETEEKVVTDYRLVNTTLENGSIITEQVPFNKTVTVPKVLEEVIGTEDIGLRVSLAPTSNIKRGLDLQGGTRVMLAPREQVSAKDLETILDNLKQRLNVFGLTDVVVREASDLSGNQYIMVEIAGANEEEVRELMAKQGKFEAKIINQTVFKGGDDITYVCRSAECAGIDPQRGCDRSGQDWFCRFRFSVSMTPEAGERQAAATQDLEVITEQDGDYLSENINFFLDDQLVDSLRIGADLKGSSTTEIAISGSSSGSSQQEAITNSLREMKRLQTILITGSLPVKLDVVKSDAISPILGEEFLLNALFIAALSIVAVALIILIRYRKPQIAVTIMVTMASEIFLILGLASLIGWNIDLAAIAGIIVALGTGVDDQIIITDELLRGQKSKMFVGLRERIKRAFFIIIAAYVATVVAMLPLMRAGAGLLKGFAITTILGVTIGVLITRPAFASIIEKLLRD
ncbi:MAG: hypothetical protein KJ709_06505 [Nanoarchaeota archaeon]|nr:hypothetical protein [Nanoarchaeota archaeon]